MKALPASTSTLTACEHCGLQVPAAFSDDGADMQFCCNGCRVAYDTIRSCGLDAYYGYRDRFADDRRAASGKGKRYASFDSEAFLKRHTDETNNGLRAVDFRLEGVHCAACVWLVERLARVTPGVVESRLSLGASRARIVWDPRKTDLSAIAIALDRLGYAPHPARDTGAHAARDRADRSRLVQLAIAGALAGNNMLISVALYAGVFEGIEPEFARLFRWLSMGLGLLSLAWPGSTFFRGAWAAVRTRTSNLDLPIALALAVGGIAGTANVLLDRGEIYFDSLSTLVFLLLVGRLIQSRQQRWVEEAVGAMLSLTPDACRVVRDGRVVEESIDALEPGDIVEVRPGELFPADGEVCRGKSAVNQSLLTGESLPVPVETGSRVFAGAQNVTSTLRVTVEQVGATTRVGELSRLVGESLSEKPPVVQLADRIGAWFVTVIALLSALNFVWWAYTSGMAEAIESSVALLIVACPCALGLATPLTMAAAIAHGSKRGMLIKNAAVLERIAEVDQSRPGRLLLDKTGTLTTGNLRVAAWSGDLEARRLAVALESESNHPIALALVREFGPSDPNDNGSITNRHEQHGYGVLGESPLGALLVGSVRLATEQRCEISSGLTNIIERGQQLGHTVVVVAIDDRVRGVAWLRDELHESTSDALVHLERLGWRSEVLSGDEPGAVLRVAAALGVPEARAHGGVSPEEKLACVRERIAHSERGPVMMVGDGVNDAAALAAADIGVAVHGGAEASLAAADVYLADAGVAKLADLCDLARQTKRVVRRNLAISFMYNGVAVCLAIAGWITPLVAALLMPLSSATVLASAVAFGAKER